MPSLYPHKIYSFELNTKDRFHASLSETEILETHTRNADPETLLLYFSLEQPQKLNLIH